MKKNLKIIGTVLAGGAALGTLLSNLFFNISLKRPNPKKIRENDGPYSELLSNSRKWFRSQNPERLTIESFDGLKLVGHYLPCENAKRTVICVHGYYGSGIRDFAYIGQFYHQNQSNILLIDQRGHGESEGTYIDMGIKARYDCKQWAELIDQMTEDNLPIYLDGVSMGAATVMMAGGLNLPASVHGIIADCGYSSPWEQVRYSCGHAFHLPEFPTVYLVNLQCRIRGGFSLRDAAPVDALKHCKVPVLFVHGEDDDFVPTYMSQVNYDACTSEKQLEIIPHATHAVSYLVDTERCNQTILQFFDKYDY